MRRIGIGIAAFSLTLSACVSDYDSPGKSSEDTGDAESAVDADSGICGDVDSATPCIQVDTVGYVIVYVGYCSLRESTDGGANWSSPQYANVAKGQDEVRLIANTAGALLQVECDNTVVPQYPLPQVNIRPEGICPVVYCDGSGSADRASCPNTDSIWAYVYTSPNAIQVNQDSGNCDNNEVGF